MCTQHRVPAVHERFVGIYSSIWLEANITAWTGSKGISHWTGLNVMSAWSDLEVVSQPGAACKLFHSLRWLESYITAWTGPNVMSQPELSRKHVAQYSEQFTNVSQLQTPTSRPKIVFYPEPAEKYTPQDWLRLFTLLEHFSTP